MRDNLGELRQLAEQLGMGYVIEEEGRGNHGLSEEAARAIMEACEDPRVCAEVCDGMVDAALCATFL